MQARHEYKHYLNYMDYIVLRSRLYAILNQDENVNENGEYQIRSLYFDTESDKVLREKIDGVNKREKFRIRFYDGNTDFIMLEKKCRFNGLGYKLSARIQKEEVERILNSDIEWMANDKRQLIVELYSKMTGQLLLPRTIVDYIREPFVYEAGNVRITLDREIKTGLYSTNLFDKDLPTIAPVDMTYALLEVKYDAFLPSFIKQILQIGNRSASACSKYALARIYG